MPFSQPDPAPPRYIGRFAPSPTGPLHFGSLVAALASYLDARAAGGAWLVRMEDVDETRCRPDWADRILRQLESLGLTWDSDVWVQSRRKHAYQAALDELIRLGRAFPCSCSRREIADHAVAGIDGPVYPGTCRAGPTQTGEPLAWRMRTDDAPIAFEDAIQGLQTQVLSRDVGDFVIKRRDGLTSYQLAVVVDDAAQAVTHVVRGADLLDSTPRQIHLLQALGHPLPRYAHVPVAVNASGQKLSKQTLAPGLHEAAPPAARVEMLNLALQFLGQPSIEAETPNDLLQHALATWNIRRVPARSSLPAPPGLSA